MASSCELARTTDRTVHPAGYLLHHSQVLQVFMRLEQRIAYRQLNQYAATTPQITWVAPTQPQDHLQTKSCTTARTMPHLLHLALASHLLLGAGRQHIGH